ncbi:uncharacterized protein LOC131539226 [Onychostoma macrolepis]|uniref:uncharacterized protein LOC131539226 n=1 Tax=Onychostoma macrolepis TaxID=369639 RepID=UPI00272CD02E|nr:uncharacterized protein LOC131539226 [Onychostoma macrolepis]
MLKSVRTMEAPQPEKGWTRHRARILHETASFQNVANNWKKASYTSDLNSEPEIAGKRIPKKKTSSDHIYSSDDEAEQQPIKKRKAANKASVPPAPKPPAIPKRNKKGPVVQPQVSQSRAVNPLSTSFVNRQQKDMEDQQNWCESLPSFQAPVRMSQPDHHRDSWCVDQPNTQEHTFAVLRPSGDHQGRAQTPVGVSQSDHHGDGWSASPPDTQETCGAELWIRGESINEHFEQAVYDKCERHETRDTRRVGQRGASIRSIQRHKLCLRSSELGIANVHYKLI